MLWLLLILAALPCKASFHNQRTLLQGDDGLDGLPLQVVATTPATLLSGDGPERIPVEGMQPLQVVFSRPVISLGSDFDEIDVFPFSIELNSSVAPRIRWVSTYIARYDPPEGGWPTDIEAPFTWDRALESWDGVSLQSDDLQDRVLFTPGLQVQLQGVNSEGAKNATGGAWRSNWRKGFTEVPDDGVVSLSFIGSPVDGQLLSAATVTTNGSATEVTLAELDCPILDVPFPVFVGPGNGGGSVICVTFEGMQPDTEYTLTFPAGSRYNDFAGPLQSDISVSFHSTLPFTSPLKPSGQLTAETPEDLEFTGVTSTRLQLFMPHGLAAGTTGDDLLTRISLVELDGNSSSAVAIEASIVKSAYVHVVAPIVPGSKYRLDISPLGANNSVVSDPFFGDQPLETLSPGTPDSVTFSARLLFDRVEHPGGPSTNLLHIQEAPDAWEYPVMVQTDPTSNFKNGEQYLVGAPVFQDGSDDASALTVAQVLDFLYGGPQSESILLKTDAQNVHAKMAAADLSIPNLFVFDGLDGAALLDATGLAMVHIEEPGEGPDSFYAYHQVVVSTSDVLLGIVKQADAVTVWAVSAADGAPVPDVQVTLHSHNFQNGASSLPVVATDVDGIAFIPLIDPESEGEDSEVDGPAAAPLSADYYYNYFDYGSSSDFADGNIVATAETPAGQLVFVDLSSVFTHSDTSGPPIVGRLILDRAVVAPGHVLHVSGYFREQDAGQFAVPAGVSARLSLCTSNSCSSEPYPLAFDAQFGSFNTTIEFTQDLVDTLGYNPATVAVEACLGSGCDEFASLDSAVVVIADPRPPTAELALEAPAWTAPNSTVALSGSATSLLGADVSGASVSIQYSVVPGMLQPFEVEGEGVAGAIEVTTDDNGEFTAELDLGSLFPSPASGAVLEFEAVWIGPTRERLTAAKSTQVQYTPFTVALVTSANPAELIPARLFHITADVNGLVEPQGTLQVSAVKMTAALCSSAVSCDESRFDMSDDDDYYGFYDYSFPSGPLPSTGTDLSPEEQSVLLKNAEVICEGVPAVGSSWEDCSWTLPDFGIYAVVACLDTGNSSTPACSAAYAGKLMLEWEESPLKTAPTSSWRWKLPAGQDGFDVGQNATVEIDSPVGGANALLVWASSSSSDTVTVDTIAAGLNTVSVPIDDSCSVGCTLSIMVSWPRGSPGALPAGLPVHPILDTAAASMHHCRAAGSAAFPVTSAQSVLLPTLQVNSAAANASEVVVEPGSSFNISVEVTECASGAPNCSAGPTSDVQVFVFAVDKAWLLLQPYELPDPASLFTVDLAPELGFAASTNGIVNASALDLWTQANSAVLTGNPWAQLMYLNRLNLSPEEWLETQFQSLADDDYYGGFAYEASAPAGAPLEASDAPTPPPSDSAVVTTAETTTERSFDADDGAEAAAPGSTNIPRITSPLDTTPFFRVLTLSAGDAAATGQIQVAAPQTLSTYVLRAFAASANGEVFGSGESEFTVRLPVSLVPSVPRIVRIGDQGTAGVIVTFPGPASAAEPVTVAVSLNVSGAATLEGPPEQQVVFDGSAEQQEVRWAVTAAELGDASLVFSAAVVDGAAAQDALTVRLESLATQAPVTLASSFAVAAGEDWQEGLQVPEALPGTGELSVVAGVGNLPAQLTMFQQLLNSVPEPPLVRAPWVISVAAVHSVLHTYGTEALGTGIAVEPRSARILGLQPNTTVCVALSAAVSFAVDALEGLTAVPRLGLMYYPINSYPFWREPERVDVTLILQTRLSILWAELYGTAATAVDSECGNSSALAGLVGSSEGWMELAINQLFADALESRRDYDEAYWSLSNLAMLWAVEGTGFELEALLSSSGIFGNDLVMAAVAQDLALARLIQEVPNLSSYETGLLALTLSNAMTSAPANATAVLDDLYTRHNDALRITARTAYIATSPASADPASAKGQAAVLVATLDSGNTTAVVEKHSNFIAARMGGSSPYYISEFSVSLTMYALSAYDTSTNSTQPNLELTVRSDPVEILTAAFMPGSAALERGIVSFDDLASPANPVEFLASGTGEASVAALLTFVPAQLPTSPSFRGLQVDLAVRRYNATSELPYGPLLSAVPLAATVHVLAQVTSPDDLQKTTVRVLLPGGLEPIDPNLDDGGAVNVCPVPWYLQSYSTGGFFGPWFVSCPRVETTPTNVTFYLERLSPGSHEFAFLAIAASPGTYTLPPAIAFVDDEPEVLGLSGGRNLTVCESAVCSEAEAALADTAAPEGVVREKSSASRRCDASIVLMSFGVSLWFSWVLALPVL